ncbi:putative Phytochrome [Aurantimonas manganoxydans SI85-9A1]|uniref:Putative Phytochrome n=2 Tax=Aurantimonas manganoxydans TaxID=651183 RepID=Q1YII9_AURMS|nr:histidine kinase dimerization/phosphoacceptor domain -containing protein [Aurantimonas manganoxydans]EAS50128.1 putative Phytochrome [Aurantimonas manganoxydans SI85-9A1]BAT29356.1 putative phytochrome [Aurantimonas manganoxydans SI85-9A1]
MKADIPASLQDSLRAVSEDELTLCDREPIHIPGSIQPHGMLLVADRGTLDVVAGAGDIEGRLAPQWLGRPLASLIGSAAVEIALGIEDETSAVLDPVTGLVNSLDGVAHRTGEYLLIELEDAERAGASTARIFTRIEEAGAALARTHDLLDLCEAAVQQFRAITGYDRVMIYRFHEDGAGSVVAEDRAPHLVSFLNHQFPATDIPKQARALYVRNRIRVIPDVCYEPAPIRAAEAGLSEVDLSDVGLRSVSPIHIRYLQNMAVGASASISIVMDGHLWGLVACHHDEAKAISLSDRTACRILAHTLSQQIAAKDEAELTRERVRIRASEDTALALYDPESSFESFMEGAGPELCRMLGADGLAVLSGAQITTFGRCPDEADLRTIGEWVKDKAAPFPFLTDRLALHWPEAKAFQSRASGLLAVSLSTETPICLIWLRAEKIETVEWAGNPHKGASSDPNAVLTPRSSFETWSDTVRGRSRPWSIAEVESASRVGRLLRERRQAIRLRELNRDLLETVRENQLLLQQKGFLLREVNHRVQNSLQLVAAFLRMQARDLDDAATKSQLSEAQRRLNAVALVHRRLYSGESVEIVDLSRYIRDLWTDLASSMDGVWAERARLDLAPVQIAADRAVHVGLIMTELVINTQKYAYDGKAGPLAIRLDQHLGRFRLAVSDRGAGKSRDHQGFGSKMMRAMVDQIEGTLEEAGNRPGLVTTVSAPVERSLHHGS